MMIDNNQVETILLDLHKKFLETYNTLKTVVKDEDIEKMKLYYSTDKVEGNKINIGLKTKNFNLHFKQKFNKPVIVMDIKDNDSNTPKEEKKEIGVSGMSKSTEAMLARGKASLSKSDEAQETLSIDKAVDEWFENYINSMETLHPYYDFIDPAQYSLVTDASKYPYVKITFTGGIQHNITLSEFLNKGKVGLFDADCNIRFYDYSWNKFQEFFNELSKGASVYSTLKKVGISSIVWDKIKAKFNIPDVFNPKSRRVRKSKIINNTSLPTKSTSDKSMDTLGIPFEKETQIVQDILRGKDYMDISSDHGVSTSMVKQIYDRNKGFIESRRNVAKLLDVDMEVEIKKEEPKQLSLDERINLFANEKPDNNVPATDEIDFSKLRDHFNNR